MADIFEKLRNFNKSMRDPQNNTLTQNNEINGFMKKLELWKTNIKRNIFDTFPTF
jgi:hypothetical protein